MFALYIFYAIALVYIVYALVKSFSWVFQNSKESHFFDSFFLSYEKFNEEIHQRIRSSLKPSLKLFLPKLDYYKKYKKYKFVGQDFYEGMYSLLGNKLDEAVSKFVSAYNRDIQCKLKQSEDICVSNRPWLISCFISDIYFEQKNYKAAVFWLIKGLRNLNSMHNPDSKEKLTKDEFMPINKRLNQVIDGLRATFQTDSSENHNEQLAVVYYLLSVRCYHYCDFIEIKPEVGSLYDQYVKYSKDYLALAQKDNPNLTICSLLDLGEYLFV